MADNTRRTVAEKLAAAKKKHKAYMREKALKNVVDSKEQQIHDVPTIYNNNVRTESKPSPLEKADANLQNQLIIKGNTDTPQTVDSAYEADLPLPQYPVENNYESSSLPDPLSFFDNFNYSNVGTSFQNLTQPLTSFFNNSNKSESCEVIESPNQILVENEKPNMNINNENNPETKDLVTQQMFSYDRFKSDAIKNNEGEVQKHSNLVNVDQNEFDKNHVFDEFTNCMKTGINSNKLAPSYEDFENTAMQTSFVNGNMEEVIPNIINTENILENASLQVQTNLKIPDVDNENENSLFSSGRDNLGNIFSKTSFSSQYIQNLSKEMGEYSRNMKDNIDVEVDIQNKEKLLVDVRPDERNQEILSLVEQQNAKLFELTQKLYETETKYNKLVTEYSNLGRIETMDNTDLTKLRDDLQCHLQTIGMLVAEKTELTTILEETQAALRNESAQCIDLQSEMKEMRISYSNIENELQILKSEKMNIDSSQREQSDMFEKMRKELEERRSQCEGHTLDLFETKEKIKAVTEMNSNLQKQVQELNGQLSMANIKIQQLTLQESPQLENHIQKLMDEKLSQEKQISMLNNLLKTASKEREESSLQYQQYAEQLNEQILNLVKTVEKQQKENDHLKIQEENRIKHIGDLEKQLQNVQSDNTSYNLQRNNSFLKKELESSTELAQSLQVEKEQLNMSLISALSDKDMLQKEVENYKFSLSQLESTVEQLRGNQPDNAVLLATMESDKVAASRAMAQNNELKKQMEGMQEVMLKVNNDNVQLTEIVSLERRTNKELLEKLQKTEISFQTLAEAIEIKDKELVHLRGHIEKMSKQMVHQEHLSDRLRHYEAQNNSSPSLQVELQEAKQMITHLTNELNILKRNQLNQTTQMNQTVPIDQVDQINQTDRIDQMNQINQTNRINHINQINQTNGVDLSTQNTQTHDSSNKHDQVSDSDAVEELRTQLNNLRIRNEELESLAQKVQSVEMMKHLETKFLKKMDEIAKLTEEKQRLEHLVLQLQGETETIGEYVTLYQQQRSILKQRALEKDQQLQQLTNDRETIKANLDRLNNLVKKLIMERSTSKEALEPHEHLLCPEHQEVNKTDDGLDYSFDNSHSHIAEEITALLYEIKSSNLVQPNEEGLHHCPCCSGKLITV